MTNANLHFWDSPHDEHQLGVKIYFIYLIQNLQFIVDKLQQLRQGVIVFFEIHWMF